MLTLCLKNFILSLEIIDILLMSGIFPPHELYVISSLLQNLGPTCLKSRAILQEFTPYCDLLFIFYIYIYFFSL